MKYEIFKNVEFGGTMCNNKMYFAVTNKQDALIQGDRGRMPAKEV